MDVNGVLWEAAAIVKGRNDSTLYQQMTVEMEKWIYVWLLWEMKLTEFTDRSLKMEVSKR